MCPFNPFFQGVACAVVQLELQALGLSTTYESMPIATPAGADAAWAGVKRLYFYDDTYYLPHAVLDGGAAATCSTDLDRKARRDLDLDASKPDDHIGWQQDDHCRGADHVG